jgi:polyisoprenoid-binding protein YceI
LSLAAIAAATGVSTHVQRSSAAELRVRRRAPRAWVSAFFLAGRALAGSAAGDEPSSRNFSLKSGALTYRLVHKLHEVQGTTRSLEGRAVVQPDGSARIQVRAKVASFDSGNANRDAHMREATHEPVHSYASVKGTLQGLHPPLTAAVELPLSATLELNGVKQEATIPVRLSQEGPLLRAVFSFPISLEAFHVERPELLFVKVDDKVQVTGDVSFEEAR